MTALFIKEFKQGRPLLIFGAAMAILIAAAHAVLLRAIFLYARYGGHDTLTIHLAFGVAILAIVPLLGVLAGSGVFSAEAHSGTAPLLFSLPLGRLRIWLSKSLAALALAIAASLGLVVITRLLLRDVYRTFSLAAHLPDLACWLLCWLSVALLCSALTRSYQGAIAATFVLGGALVGGAAALVFYYGAPILGPPVLDLALWCALFSPALLAGSALVVTRGELLQSFRLWHALGLLLALLGTAGTVLLVCGVVRAATRYQRADVAVISKAHVAPGGRILSLLTHANRLEFPMARAEPVTVSALLARRSYRPEGQVLPKSGQVLISFPTSYLVGLDLNTREERSTVRAPAFGFAAGADLRTAFSPDGRYRADLGRPVGFTYGRREDKKTRLRIVDLERESVVYEGIPDPLRWERQSWVPRWLPSGGHLALVRSHGGGETTIHVLRPDGSPARTRPVRLRSVAFAPNDDLIYGFDRDERLCRVGPGDSSRTVVWSPPSEPEDVYRWFGEHAISPDGRYIAVAESYVGPPEDPAEEATILGSVLVIDTETGESAPVWRRPNAEPFALTWSGDGRSLYLPWRPQSTDSRRGLTRPLHVDCWTRAREAVTDTGVETAAGWTELHPRPDSDQVVLWTQQLEEMESGTPGPVSGDLLLVGPDRARPLNPTGDPARAALECKPIGFHPDGRLLLLADDVSADVSLWMLYHKVEALNLDTGEASRIYP